ncbi:MAG: hypothetical protein PVG99_06090 [Desulfobacteraceae bacterium]
MYLAVIISRFVGLHIAQTTRNLLEGFWVVIGLLFVIGGLWTLFEPKLPLLPIVLILAGLVLIVSILKGKRPNRP